MTPGELRKKLEEAQWDWRKLDSISYELFASDPDILSSFHYKEAIEWLDAAYDDLLEARKAFDDYLTDWERQ